MKVNDILNESPWSDLVDAGRIRQAQQAKQFKQNAGSVFRDLKNAMTPNWYKNMANRIAQGKQEAEMDQMADEWTDQWEAVVDRLAKAKQPGQVISLEEYKRALTKWIEQQTKTTPDQKQLNTSITEPDKEMVKNYFAKYYIPMYMAKQQVEAEKDFARQYGIDVDDPADLDAAAKQADAGEKPTGTDGADRQDAEEPDEEPDEEEFEPDETFTYTDSQGEPVEIATKDGDYYIVDEKTGEFDKLTHPEDIAAVKEHDPAEEAGEGEPADEEKLAQAVEAAKKDRGTDANVPGSKQDFHVVTYTPNLVIRYKNQEFMMVDENYPQRDWFKLPNGTPVKAVMVPMLNKMADEAFAEQDKASAGGEEETDIDAAPNESAGVRVEPGTKLRVTDPKINGTFYKDAMGNWTTEDGRKLKKAETLKYLEKLVKDGAPTRTEKVLPPTPEEKKKGIEK